MFEKDENKSESGWYHHKETNTFVELTNDPTYGTPLTNAYIKAGYVYVGKTDPRKTEEVVSDETPKKKTITKKEG